MKFLCDQMLGTLATWLRILGHDTAYAKTGPDEKIIAQAHRENRVVLTRDKELASSYKPSLAIKNTDLYAQVKEVLQGFTLNPDKKALLSRCTVCNVLVKPVEKSAVKNIAPPHAYAIHNNFWLCPSCNRIYWKGSHWENMQRFIGSLWQSTTMFPDNGQ